MILIKNKITEIFGSVLKFFLFILFIIGGFTSCQAEVDRFCDFTPVAQVGDSVITKGFLDYALNQMKITSASANPQEVLVRMIDNAAIARKVKAFGGITDQTFLVKLEQELFATKRDYLYQVYSLKEKNQENLYLKFADEYNIKIPAINWNEIILPVKRADIPLFGKIPKAEDKQLSRENEITPRAAEIIISSKVSSYNLAELIKGANDESFSVLRNGTDNDKLNVLHNLLNNAFIPVAINDLSGKQKKLLSEIQLHLGEQIAYEFYRRSIGFIDFDSGSGAQIIYPASDDEIRNYYENNKEKLSEPLSITISHILVKDIETADRLKSELDKDPAKFAEYARKYSIAPDAKNGGYIGEIKFKVGLPMAKSFAFTLIHPGQIGIPVTTSDGIEIIKMHHRKDQLLPLSSPTIRQEIIKQLQPAKREAKLKSDIEAARKDAGVKIF